MQKILAALTDMSFKRFVTPQLATVIYIIGIIFIAVLSLSLFNVPSFGFVLAPVTFVAGIIFLRCGLELVLAVFQIARYSAEIARRGRPADTIEAEELTNEQSPE